MRSLMSTPCSQVGHRGQASRLGGGLERRASGAGGTWSAAADWSGAGGADLRKQRQGPGLLRAGSFPSDIRLWDTAVCISVFPRSSSDQCLRSSCVTGQLWLEVGLCRSLRSLVQLQRAVGCCRERQILASDWCDCSDSILHVSSEVAFA